LGAAPDGAPSGLGGAPLGEIVRKVNRFEKILSAVERKRKNRRLVEAVAWTEEFPELFGVHLAEALKP